MTDPWDLNTVEPHQFRLYAGRNADYAALVDEEDYRHFSQWLWQPQFNKSKIYFRRALTIRNGADDRYSGTVYLHIEICRRAHGEAPTRRRNLVDHWNGYSLDCRRDNLRWATRLENNRNRFGLATSRVNHPVPGQ